MKIVTSNGQLTLVGDYSTTTLIKEARPRKPTQEEMRIKQLRDQAGGGIQPVPAAQAPQVGMGIPMPQQAPMRPAVPMPQAPIPQPARPMTGPQGAAAAANSPVNTQNPLATTQAPQPSPENSLDVNQLVNVYNAAKNINFDELKGKPDHRDAAKVLDLAQNMATWAAKAIQVLGDSAEPNVL